MNLTCQTNFDANLLAGIQLKSAQPYACVFRSFVTTIVLASAIFLPRLTISYAI